VRWLDASSQIIREDSQNFHFVIISQLLIGNVETRFSAPSGTVAAEIRVVLPEGTFALDSVSFAPTLETVSNATFSSWETQTVAGEVPVAWPLNSGLVERNNDVHGARLRGDADVPEDTVISQATPIVAGETYELNIRATPFSPPPENIEMQPIISRARFELRWLNDAGPIGASIIMPLDGRDFSGHGWRGAAPTGATQAEIKLIQPKNDDGLNDVGLLVESVSFRRIDFVRVPLLFLAETPGELTAANFRVTFDMAETETALASSTTAAARDTSPVVSERIVIDEEECEEDHACEKAPTMRSQPVASPEVTQPPAITVQPAKSPQATLPLTEIDGIGKTRAQRLTKMGIDSVEKLAKAEPQKVAKGLGLSSESAEKFIAAAKTLM
jgi:predicted flap endonuclease-1-like 5' DNA nuclease